MYKLFKLAGVSACVLSLAAAPTMAQVFGDWNTNDDEFIQEEEFNTGFGEADAFGEWDENDDEALDENEFSAGVYEGYDEDDDGLWSEEEYNTYASDLEEDDGWF